MVHQVVRSALKIGKVAVDAKWFNADTGFRDCLHDKSLRILLGFSDSLHLLDRTENVHEEFILQQRPITNQFGIIVCEEWRRVNSFRLFELDRATDCQQDDAPTVRSWEWTPGSDVNPVDGPVFGQQRFSLKSKHIKWINIQECSWYPVHVLQNISVIRGKSKSFLYIFDEVESVKQAYLKLSGLPFNVLDDTLTYQTSAPCTCLPSNPEIYLSSDKDDGVQSVDESSKDGLEKQDSKVLACSDSDSEPATETDGDCSNAVAQSDISEDENADERRVETESEFGDSDGSVCEEISTCDPLNKTIVPEPSNELELGTSIQDSGSSSRQHCKEPCKFGRNWNGQVFNIQCAVCKIWFHGDCAGVKKGHVGRKDIWVCSQDCEDDLPLCGRVQTVICGPTVKNIRSSRQTSVCKFEKSINPRTTMKQVVNGPQSTIFERERSRTKSKSKRRDSKAIMKTITGKRTYEAVCGRGTAVSKQVPDGSYCKVGCLHNHVWDGAAFVIQCTCCKKWFHGDCVAVVKGSISADTAWVCCDDCEDCLPLDARKAYIIVGSSSKDEDAGSKSGAQISQERACAVKTIVSEGNSTGPIQQNATGEFVTSSMTFSSHGIMGIGTSRTCKCERFDCDCPVECLACKQQFHRGRKGISSTSLEDRVLQACCEQCHEFIRIDEFEDQIVHQTITEKDHVPEIQKANFSRENEALLGNEVCNISTDSATNQGPKPLYCTLACKYYRQEGDDFMIECSTCKQWFHGECVGVLEDSVPPQAAWVCCFDCEEDLPLHARKDEVIVGSTIRKKRRVKSSSKDDMEHKKSQDKTVSSSPPAMSAYDFSRPKHTELPDKSESSPVVAHSQTVEEHSLCDEIFELPQALAVIMGKSKASRPELMRSVLHYVTDNELLDVDDQAYVHVDSVLQNVIGDVNLKRCKLSKLAKAVTKLMKFGIPASKNGLCTPNPQLLPGDDQIGSWEMKRRLDTCFQEDNLISHVTGADVTSTAQSNSELLLNAEVLPSFSTEQSFESGYVKGDLSLKRCTTENLPDIPSKDSGISNVEGDLRDNLPKRKSRTIDECAERNNMELTRTSPSLCKRQRCLSEKKIEPLETDTLNLIGWDTQEEKIKTVDSDTNRFAVAVELRFKVEELQNSPVAADNFPGGSESEILGAVGARSKLDLCLPIPYNEQHHSVQDGSGIEPCPNSESLDELDDEDLRVLEVPIASDRAYSEFLDVIIFVQMMERGEVPTKTTTVIHSSSGMDEAEGTAESGGQDSDDDIDISVLEQLESMCWSVLF